MNNSETAAWKYLGWLFIALVASVLWLDFWLALAGVEFFPGFIKVERLPESAQSAAVSAAATGAAGIAGLWTYFLTRDQKERHQAVNAEDALCLAEYQRLEGRYAQLAVDFVSGSKIAEISAAISMAELAREPNPYQRAANEKRSAFQLTKLNKTKSEYPYYEKVVNRLVAAQLHWNEPISESTVNSELVKLAAWSQDPGTGEPLLRMLINGIAGSCRELQIEFSREMANYHSHLSYERGAEAAKSEIKNLEDALGFTQHSWATHTPFREISNGLSNFWSSPRRPDEQSIGQSQLACTSVGLKLKCSRATLLAAMKLLSAQLEPLELEELDLHQIWFIGADLSRMNLRKSNFHSCILNGVNLSFSDLRDGSFIGSTIVEPDLRYANFQNTRLDNVRFDRPKMFGMKFLPTGTENGIILLNQFWGAINRFRNGPVDVWVVEQRLEATDTEDDRLLEWAATELNFDEVELRGPSEAFRLLAKIESSNPELSQLVESIFLKRALDEMVSAFAYRNVGGCGVTCSARLERLLSDYGAPWRRLSYGLNHDIEGTNCVIFVECSTTVSSCHLDENAEIWIVNQLSSKVSDNILIANDISEKVDNLFKRFSILPIERE